MCSEKTRSRTGDLPTPIKYHSPAIRDSYKEIERQAGERLLSFLPEQLRETFAPLLREEDEKTLPYVKAADKLAAYLKCIEERKAGNNEFLSAEAQLLALLLENPLPELRYFIDLFIPAFERTLDELGIIG